VGSECPTPAVTLAPAKRMVSAKRIYAMSMTLGDGFSARKELKSSLDFARNCSSLSSSATVARETYAGAIRNLEYWDKLG
jgi:hypothetical protein